VQHPRREFRVLALGVLSITCFLLGVAATGFSQGQTRGTKFDEISVERINIVERDGRVRLVLANSARQAQTMVDGVVLAPGRSRPAGMIFFNEEGDEVGGLVFTGRKGDSGPQATGSLMFDQYKQDQTVALQYSEGGGRRRAGLAVIDRPTTSLAAYAPLVEKRRLAKTDEERAAVDREVAALGQPSAARMFVGKDGDGTATLALSDSQGRQRLLLSVDPAGRSSIRFLDASGQVVREVVP
jgi:hypothetical protein